MRLDWNPHQKQFTIHMCLEIRSQNMNTLEWFGANLIITFTENHNDSRFFEIQLRNILKRRQRVWAHDARGCHVLWILQEATVSHTMLSDEEDSVSGSTVCACACGTFSGARNHFHSRTFTAHEVVDHVFFDLSTVDSSPNALWHQLNRRPLPVGFHLLRCL